MSHRRDDGHHYLATTSQNKCFDNFSRIPFNWNNCPLILSRDMEAAEIVPVFNDLLHVNVNENTLGCERKLSAGEPWPFNKCFMEIFASRASERNNCLLHTFVSRIIINRNRILRSRTNSTQSSSSPTIHTKRLANSLLIIFNKKKRMIIYDWSNRPSDLLESVTFCILIWSLLKILSGNISLNEYANRI